MKYKFVPSLFILFITFFPNIVGAVEYGGFGGRPAYPQPDNPRTESIFVHTIQAGETVSEGVQVINNSGEEQDLLVYATDSARSTDGAFACKQFSEESTDVGSWISLEPTEVTIPAYESQIIPFDIVVPSTASVGEHNGCILIQKIKPESEKKRAGANISVRTGLRVALTIPGDIDRNIEIAGLDIEKTDRNTIILHPSIRNNGNVSVDVDLALTTRSFLGYVIKRNGGEYPVLRGDTSEWNFEIKKPFWGGLNFVSMKAFYSEVDNAGAKDLTLDYPTKMFFSFPTLWGFLIEIIIIGLIIFGYRKYRAKKNFWKEVEEDWGEYEVQEGESVNKIAKMCGIDWKTLARVNNIEPPYVLEAGEVIRVPYPEEE